MKGFFANLFGGESTSGEKAEPTAQADSFHPEQLRPTPFKAGDTIRNRWDVHRVMQGGMGTVYVVYDRKWCEAFAAKTFQESVFSGSPAIKARFENEATAWVNLDLHPNITEARFLDLIDGQPFLFLEYVAGGDLSRWIGTPRLLNDLVQVLRFGIQFCDGMTHAISKGIKVHRDIKPQNCLVTQDGILKITDFGLAKAWGDDCDMLAKLNVGGNASLGMSQTGAAAGTCTHMAPEQFLDSKHVDTRADIYSFGVVLFQMICGELPFIGRTFEEFGALHLRSTPPTQKVTDRRVRKVIEQCLQKNPEDRYPTFGDLRCALVSVYQTETGLRAPEPALGDDLTAFHFVNKGKSLGDLGKTEESILCFDEAIKLKPSLAEAWLNKGVSLREVNRPQDAVVCFDRAANFKPTLALAWAFKGYTLLELNRVRDGLSALKRAAELEPANPAVWARMGAALATIKEHEEAVAAYRKVVTLRPNEVTGWLNMSPSLGLLGRHGDVIECCDRALQIDPELGHAWKLKGVGLFSLRRFAEALSCFQQARKLGEEGVSVFIADCRKVVAPEADRYFRLGGQYEQEGNYLEAISCYKKGLDIDPSETVVWVSFGGILLRFKRFSEAVDCFDRAISIEPRCSAAWQNKGFALLCLGRREEGLRCQAEAKRMENAS
jgi:serine/threonine protein kinase